MRASTPPGTPLVLSGTLATAQVVLLCARVRDLLADDPRDVVICDVSAVAVNVEAVDALARLELVARRAGGRIRLLGASPELGELVALCGLTGVLLASAAPGRPAT